MCGRGLVRCRGGGTGGRAGSRPPVDRRARRLGDLRRGGPLGRQHQQLELAGRRARLDRVLGHADRRGDPRVPPLQVRRGVHRDQGDQPRLLGRPHVHERRRERLQAGHRLLHGRVGPQGPGADARGVRGEQQRARGRAADRRQQLRVRRHRRGVRGQLADVAVVVEELLQRRLGHPLALHRVAHRDRDREREGRDPQRQPGDGERGLRRRPVDAARADVLVADPARRLASAIRRPAGRGSPSAAAASGTATPTGRRTPSCRCSTAPRAPRPPRAG